MKAKLLLLSLLVPLTALSQTTKRVDCLFHSEIVTNWTVQVDNSPPNYTLPYFPDRPYQSDVKSRGMNIGTVSSNYTASIVLNGATNNITLSSDELFKIYHPWKEVLKPETVYSEPYCRTNIHFLDKHDIQWWGSGYTTNYLTNIYCATNLMLYSVILDTNVTWMTNYSNK